jgi:DNA replication protein DnaD
MDNTIYSYLEQLEELVEGAKTSMLSNTNITVSREEILGLIEDMRLNLPGEIKQAQRIVNNTSKIINEANANADLIVKQARDTADKMIMENEITQQAKEQANAIIFDAMETAKAYKVGSLEYADDVLRRAEEQFKNTIEDFQAFNEQFRSRSEKVQVYLEQQYDELYSNRMDLRNINEEADGMNTAPGMEGEMME